jgi:putative transposase
VKELGVVQKRYGFLLVGYVVMPNHVHLLIGEPKKGTPSTVLQVLKQRMSRKMRSVRRRAPESPLQLPSLKSPHEPPRFWQPRFYDFNVYSHEKKKEKLNYMHANPVTRRLVKHPREWPWSSFAFYANGESPLIRIDPLAG